MIKIITIFLIFLVGVAPLGFGWSNSFSADHVVQQSDLTKNIISIQSKHLSVNLEEHVGVATNYPSDQNIQQSTGSQKSISLLENVSILTNDMDYRSIVLMKDNYERLTTLEKISNDKRIRLDGKTISISNENFNNITTDLTEILKDSPTFIYNEIDKIILSTYHTPKLQTSVDQFNLQQTTKSELYTISNYVVKDLGDILHNVKNSTPIILVLLVPLSSYILLRSEKEKIKINENQIFSFFFVIILISSVAVTPFAISQNYWGMAFAEPFNQTNANVTVNNSVTNVNAKNFTIPASNETATVPASNETATVPASNETATVPASNETATVPASNETATVPASNETATVPASNETATVPASNETATVPASNETATVPASNETATVPASNETATVPASNETATVPASNETATVPASNETATVPASNETASKTESLPESMAISASVSISNETTIPISTKSWNFTSNNNTIGEVQTQNNTLNLQGNGYLKEPINSTNILKNFTISAWVRPDYSQGSPVFTIISKSNQFTLSINHNIPPYKIATFSIYDSVHWNTVNSTMAIPEHSWSYLTGVYNGTDISLYVNGTLQSIYRLPGVLSLSDDGHLSPVNPDQISSNADVVIGAYINPLRSSVMDQFAGDIQKVNFYKNILNPEQINAIYEQDLIGFAPTQIITLPVNATNATAITLPVNATNATAITLPVNATNATAITLPVNATNATAITLPVNATNATAITLPVNATNATAITPVNETISQIDNFSLNHDSIVVNKPVTWTQNVIMSNKTDGVQIELPADARILTVNSTTGNNMTTIFNAKNYSTTSFNQLPNSMSNTAISTNEDIGKNLTSTLQILENSTGKVPIIQENTTVDNKTIPIASLDSVSSMVEENKPTKFLVINNTGEQYSVKFETPAPYTQETNQSTTNLYKKNVTVENNSTLHYTEVKSYTEIPENLVAKGIHFKLYWMVNGSMTDVTNDPVFQVKLVDTNNNNIPDQMQWVVPHLSEQQFVVQAQLTVINVQSYPVVGGNWTVYFNTTGTADLNITAINGTLFGNSPPADLHFLTLSNGTTALTPIIQGNSIIYHNYTSTGIGVETSHVMTSGKHHLMFQFGNSVGFANNNAFLTSIDVHTPLSVVIDSSGNFIYGSALDQVGKTSPAPSLIFNKTATAAFGVGVNSTGYVFVADANNNQINIFDSSGTSAGSFTDTNGAFSSPTGVVVDSSGNIYVADTGNDRVEQFDAHRNYVRTFGSAGTGDGQFTGPMGIAIDSSGNVYVTDTGNDRIEKFSSTGVYQSQFGTTGSGNGNFNSPIGITIDSIGSIYVSDIQNDRIEKFSSTGVYQSQFGTTGSGNSNFDGPIGVAVDSSNNVYVADANNDKIKKFNPDDAVLTQSVSISASVSATKSASKSLSESMAISASVSATKSASNSLPESMAISASVSATKSASQSLSESVSISDSVSTTESASKSLSESMAISASVSATKSASQSLSESVSISDSVSTTESASKSLSESMAISASVSATKSASNSLSESVSISDSVSTTLAHSVSLSESVSISDSVSSLPLETLNPAGTISFDASSQTSIASSTSNTVTLSHTVGNGDRRLLLVGVSILNTGVSIPTVSSITYGGVSLTKITNSTNGAHVTSEMWNLVNPSSGTANIVVTFSGGVQPAAVVGGLSLNGVDQLSPIITSTTANGNSNTATISPTTQFDNSWVIDAVAAKGAPTITASVPQSERWNLIESSGVTGGGSTKSVPNPGTTGMTWTLGTSQRWATLAVEVKAAGKTTLTQTVTISDSVSASVSHTKSLSESVSISDSVSATKSASQSLSESVSISASVSATKSASQSLSESVSISDSVSTTKSASQSLSESVSISDSVSTTLAHSVSLSESVSISDSVSTTKSASQSLSESVSISDSVSTAAAKTQSLSESVSISDSVSTAAAKTQSLSESVSISDSVSTTIAHSVSLSESVSISDSVSTTKSASQSLSESVSISDSVSTAAAKTQSLSESVSISDSVSTAAAKTQSLSESVSISDSVSTTIAHSVSLSESMAISDSVSTTKSASQSLSESVSISDSVSTAAAKTQSLSESVSISDSVSTAAAKTQSLSESVSISDSVSTTIAHSVSLSESVSISDSVSTTKSASQSLSESVSISDSVSTAAAKTQSLSESVSISDSVSTAAAKTQSLSESVSISDSVSTTIAHSVSLSESVSISDSVSTTKSASQSLSESVSISDSVSTAAAKTQSLSESVSISDSVSTAAAKTQSLSESVSISDSVSTTIAHSVSLSESMAISDSVSTTKSASQSLSESVSISDSVSTAAAKTQSLSESVSISDSVSTAAAKTQSLSESVSISDSTSANIHHIASLSESVSISDSVSTTIAHSVSLSESMAISDSVSTTKSASQSLSESVSISDSVSTAAAKTQSLSESVSISDSTSANIHHIASLSESVSISDSVSTAAAKTQSLSESVSISDSVSTTKSASQSLSESVSISDSVSTTKSASQSLSESVSISDSVSTTKAKSQSLSESVSISDSASASASHVKSLSESVDISDTTSTITLLSKSLSESVSISDSVSHTTAFDKTLNEIMSLSSSATSLENLAPNQYLVENSQTHVTVNPSTPQLVITNSSAALSTITVPSTVTTPQINYTIITSGGSATIGNSLTISTDTNGDTKTEIKLTIPSSTTITGTSWNGLLQLPSIDTTSNLVYPVQPGQVTTPSITINLGSSTPLTFNHPVRLLFVGESGKHVGFFHTSPIITEITAACTSDSISGIPAGANECKINVGHDLVVWTKHFTGFGSWGSSSSSSGTGGQGGGGGGGGGYTGVGPSQYGTTEGAIVANLTSALKILKVSYDTCDTNMVQILVAYSQGNPSIILRSSLTGVVQAQLAKDQPFAVENENADVKKLVYQVPLSAKENTFEILALQAIGHDIISVGKTVEMTSCKGEVSFEGELAVAQQQIDLSAPRIFDVKFQIDNGTKIPSSEDNHYTSPQPITVSAIVDSKTTLDQAELRFVKAGDLANNYVSVKMDVTPIQITNSTYMISGTIPSDAIQAPAVSYWINLHNVAGKAIESDHYGIGVKPTYQVNGKLELDVRPTRIEGTVAHPSAYFTNTANGPVYGSISLLINGNTVYTSPAQVFSTGENAVNLEWKSATVGYVSQHTIQSKVEIYGQSFETASSSVTTFPGTVNIPLYKLENIQNISLGNHTIAKASVLYSSFSNDGTMRFKVTAPDGTCVIGNNENCLVTQSTLGHGGNIKSVTIGDQIFRVRYTGSDSPLERFSITSIDPITGTWKVEVDSKTGLVPMADAMNDVILKVKYNDIDTSRITLPYSK